MASSYNFPLRLDDTLREKLRYIANENSRSLNKEIEFIVKQYVSNYERGHGEILLPEKE